MHQYCPSRRHPIKNGHNCNAIISQSIMGGIPVARTKLVHTLMECLLPTHLPCTDYFNPSMKSVQKINFAMKWEEKDNMSIN